MHGKGEVKNTSLSVNLYHISHPKLCRFKQQLLSQLTILCISSLGQAQLSGFFILPSLCMVVGSWQAAMVGAGWPQMASLTCLTVG